MNALADLYIGQHPTLKVKKFYFHMDINIAVNPQSLQEIATGAGKTITTATLSIAEQHGRSYNCSK